MNWRIDWDIVLLGRAIGVAIVLIGFGLSAWDVLDFPAGVSSFGTGYKIRYFLHGVLSFLASGGLLIVAAEIADRLGWGRADEAPTQEAQPTLTPES